MFDKSKPNPLADAARKIMESNAKDRQVIAELNQKLGIQDRRQLPNEKLAAYDRLLGETLAKPNLLKEENLQELSKDTLKSYIKSAQREVDAVEKFQGAFPKDRQKLLMKVFKNNKEGVMRAKDRLNGFQSNDLTASKTGNKWKIKPYSLKEKAKTPSYESILAEVRKNLGEEAIMESEFGAAFKAARQQGKTEFEFGGKKFNTMQKGEDSAKWKAEMAAQAKRGEEAAKSPPSPQQRPTADGESGNPVATAKEPGNNTPVKQAPAEPTFVPKADPRQPNPAPEGPQGRGRPAPTGGTVQPAAAATRNMNKVNAVDVGLATPTPTQPKPPAPVAQPTVATVPVDVKSQVSAAVNAPNDNGALQAAVNKKIVKEEKKPYRTMTSIVESIQNKDYLNESNT